MQARRNPKIAALARALDETRHTGPAASAGWTDRMADRMRGARPAGRGGFGGTAG
jgi:hypothetical protein